MNKASKISLIVIACSIFIIVGILSISSSSDSSTPKAQTLKNGDEGYVSIDGNQTVMIATTKENYDEMFRLFTTKDNLGITKMVAEGKILVVDDATTVKVIGSSYGSKEVRITNGKHMGGSGWIPNEMVHTK